MSESNSITVMFLPSNIRSLIGLELIDLSTKIGYLRALNQKKGHYYHHSVNQLRSCITQIHTAIWSQPFNIDISQLEVIISVLDTMLVFFQNEPHNFERKLLTFLMASMRRFEMIIVDIKAENLEKLG